MSYFKALEEGDVAVVVERGVYRQVPLYVRNNYLFAKVGGGFVRLSMDGGTSKPNLRVEALVYSGLLYRDKLRRLCTEDAADAQVLTAGEAAPLFGVA